MRRARLFIVLVLGCYLPTGEVRGMAMVAAQTLGEPATNAWAGGAVSAAVAIPVAGPAAGAAESTTAPKVALPARRLKDQPAQGGELIWLRFVTETGRAARRVFKDQERVVREIWYTSKAAWTSDGVPVKDPAALREQSTTINDYDAAGRMSRTMRYDMLRELVTFTDYAHGNSGEKERETTYSPEGIRQYERRYGRQPVGLLQFDPETGTKLLCFSGLAPKEMDLAHGWGEPTAGLQYGIAPSPDGRVLGTIKNVGTANMDVPRAAISLQTHPDLKDADGTIVPYDQKAVARSALVTEAGVGRLSPGYALSESYRLADWYGGLKPGRYTLRLDRLGVDGKLSLGSNTLRLEVPFPRAVLTARGDRLRAEVGGHVVDVFPDQVVERARGGAESSSAGVALTVEGVLIQMAATKTGTGRVEFSGGGRKWTATLEGGQVRLAEEGTGRSFSATKIEVRLWEGRVETLDAAKTRGNG